MYNVLRKIADSIGIEAKYTETSGIVHYTDPDTALKILEVKGISIRQDRLKRGDHVLIVAEDDLPEKFEIPLTIPLEMTDVDKIEAVINVHQQLDGESIPIIENEKTSVRINEATGLMQLKLPFLSQLAVGEHHLIVRGKCNETEFESEIKLFLCPKETYLPAEIVEGKKCAGIQIALYGVRSETNWGVGDFGDLIKVIDWAGEDLGIDFIGLNPLHALGNERPFNNSPYNPSSRFYRNFIYLDVTAIPEFAISQKAAILVESPGFRKKLDKLRNEDQVNYEEVALLKLEILQEVFRSFMENQGQSYLGNDRWTAFQEYISSEGVYLERFATFCALEKYFKSMPPHPKTWREWPAAYRNPTSPEVRKFQSNNEQSILFWMYLQWQLDEQLKTAQDYAKSKGMLIGLYNDEALAVDRNGADFWAWQEFFHEDFRVGAPPDAFAPDGQDWGFPPPDSDRIRDAAYEPFLRKLSTSCRHCGALRIDHVMQYHHLFWIPSNGKAKDGVYVKDYEMDLLNLLALISNQTRTIIIGEDLGTVPPDFRERLMSKGVLSYRLFYFERDLAENQTPYYEYPKSALVSISTHDLPTLAGFWSEKDIECREKIGQLDAERAGKFREDRTRHKAKIIERLVNDSCLPAPTAHAAWENRFPTENLQKAVFDFILRSPAHLVVVNQEDLFLDLRQQNMPGTTWENPNWVTKMKFTLEEMRSHPEAVQLCRRFAEAVAEAGRKISDVNSA